MGVYVQSEHGYALLCFYFGTACGAIIFAAATSTTILCSLGRQYGQLLCPSVIDVYELSKKVRIIEVIFTVQMFMNCHFTKERLNLPNNFKK